MPPQCTPVPASLDSYTRPLVRQNIAVRACIGFNLNLHVNRHDQCFLENTVYLGDLA